MVAGARYEALVETTLNVSNRCGGTASDADKFADRRWLGPRVGVAVLLGDARITAVELGSVAVDAAAGAAGRRGRRRGHDRHRQCAVRGGLLPGARRAVGAGGLSRLFEPAPAHPTGDARVVSTRSSDRRPGALWRHLAGAGC